MMRWALVIVTGICAASVLVPACSQSNKYRVMSFLLDGVPAPGTVSARGYTVAARGADSGLAPTANLPTSAEPKNFFTHAPYRENRCAGCHDAQSGQLVEPVNKGLCIQCHRSTPGAVRLVHGPVALNECLLCHHYHAAPYPKLLLMDAVTTCFQCHDKGDLSEGEHHAGVERQSCVECHDPHGSDERFFLKRVDR
ncbi:MAG: cytochrome c3 family protein [Planctomycetota bacterium]